MWQVYCFSCVFGKLLINPLFLCLTENLTCYLKECWNGTGIHTELSFKQGSLDIGNGLYFSP